MPFEKKAHVFPRYKSAVVVKVNQKTQIKPMQFGLIPFFEKEEKPKKIFHNARVETVSEKVSFKKPFLETRCLVPMDSFFEYIWTTETTKWIARFYSKNIQMLVAAGIWSSWKSPSGKIIDSFSILTTEPPEFILKTGHDRCPLFLKQDSFEDWLEPIKNEPKQLLKILENKEEIQFDVEKVG